jgi:hypothetical protein
MRNRFNLWALAAGAIAILLAGCNSSSQTSSPAPAAAPQVNEELQGVAEAMLGKQSEILAAGDLAHTGSQQLLVANRLANAPRTSDGAGSASGVLVTRATVAEKTGDRWTEILRCDEHLKNPRGYLGGAPTDPVTGWRLEFDANTPQGLELRFTPAEGEKQEPSSAGNSDNRTIFVRWNAKAKRYQSLNRSHQGYLSEVPSLETPQTFLR